uniref:Uncharacterized protein n=1 Tax=viral metagenome TaxID=1070528 RepID=A0A6C0C441_9ZZZZ
MSNFSFYLPLEQTNSSEQNKLGKMQTDFNNAIGKSNVSQNTMISTYISANASRKACYDECPKGWSKDSDKWKSDVEKDGSSTLAGASGGLEDVIASCRAGCDLKWDGIVQNSNGTEGVDVGKKIGRYNGKENTNIGKCEDLSKYAPKVKMGGLCDSNNECDSGLCVNWGGKCDDDNKINDSVSWLKNTGHCGLGMTRIDGGTYSWGTNFNSICKSDIEQLGMTNWPGKTQYIKYNGIWVKLKPDWGYPNAPVIDNQRLESGKYIQDEATAIKAAEAYGDYCKGFYTSGDGFILQSAGGENPKPSWNQFASELGLLNNTKVEGFGGYSSNKIDNEMQNDDTKKVSAWGKVEVADKALSSSNTYLTSKIYNDPTFPIASTKAAMGKTCPKGWDNIRNGTGCGIFNDNIRKKGSVGWNGSSFGCNLTGNIYTTDCKDVPNKSYTCWHVGAVPEGSSACKTIKGSDIPDCIASGGRPRTVNCPVPAKMILWVTRLSGSSYFATKNDLIPVLQDLSTEFPDVRLTNQTEMDDIIAKNIANCSCGWYRTDNSTTHNWRNGDANGTPGFYHIPLVNGYPSNSKTSGGCGGGQKKMIGCPTSSNSWNKGKGGIYVTVSTTLEFVMNKLSGLGYRGTIVESHQQLISKPPPNKKQVWKTGMYPVNKGGNNIFQTEKNNIRNNGANWKQQSGELVQLSTGQKEVYGVNGNDSIYARSKTPGEPNANGGKEWRGIPGALTNISASNKEWVYGVNNKGNIYQCKKPCKGGWQLVEGNLKQISGGQKYVYGVNRNDSIYRARLPIQNHTNPQWYNIPGRLKWVNASNEDYVYGTNENDNIYVCKKPCNGGWKQIRGGLERIEADGNKVYGVNKNKNIYTKPMDGMQASPNWSMWTGGDGSTNVSPEPFIGGMSREGYTPLENDMVKACKDSGTQDGVSVSGVEPTGNFLVENRRKEKEASSRLLSMQKQIKSSINRLQSENLNVNSVYKNTNINILKQLSRYELASQKLLKSGNNIDTLGALEEDSRLKKNSIGMSYYLWLTLAISVLGVAITRIK